MIAVSSLSPLRGSIALAGLTQDSQSLALGLTLTAAPQLVEGSRLRSCGCDRIDATGVSLLACCHKSNRAVCARVIYLAARMVNDLVPLPAVIGISTTLS